MAAKILFTELGADGLEADILPMDGWDDFDRLVEFANVRGPSQVLKLVNGPDARVAEVDVGDAVLTFVHTPDGNVIRAQGAQAVGALRAFCDDLGGELETAA